MRSIFSLNTVIEREVESVKSIKRKEEKKGPAGKKHHVTVRTSSYVLRDGYVRRPKKEKSSLASLPATTVL